MSLTSAGKSHVSLYGQTNGLVHCINFVFGDIVAKVFV